jgi:hypothetical protein
MTGTLPGGGAVTFTDNHNGTATITGIPLLADAVNSRRTWLQDFADDQITISSDLYEVILAYQHHIRPGA